ncbi:hypothetical protein NEIMUCOT_06368 [Neisseria mucosa ATCC 25996]|uniref:Uncharacterized protein n=1 Tax=Neisseria mucosa (strain ATCC 25996 / DSM 4631 / NCTC 10774 / M26) TaxID=546266 RepID=D3A0D2_NEIM2|nr:hypothetical protein NEIMUCOT_06368 [Neisseria mucosa ATCC 25996]
MSDILLNRGWYSMQLYIRSSEKTSSIYSGLTLNQYGVASP